MEYKIIICSFLIDNSKVVNTKIISIKCVVKNSFLDDLMTSKKEFYWIYFVFLFERSR